MMKVKSKITDFYLSDNLNRVHYSKDEDYFYLSTDNPNDLEILKKLYRSSKFEIREGIYIFDWYLVRKDYFPLGTEIDPNKFDIFVFSPNKEKESYKRLEKRIDKLWDKILNYGKGN